MIRIITTRRLRRILGAQLRHERQHAVIVREMDGLRREVDAAIERRGQLELENSVLRGELVAKHPLTPDRAALLVQLRNAEDRAKALDARLNAKQDADEAADRAGYDAAYGVRS